MVDNCGAKFHAEIASKKFLEDIELVTISPHTDLIIKQKIVSLLGNLTEMFQNEPSLYQISNLYIKLTGTRVPSTPVHFYVILLVINFITYLLINMYMYMYMYIYIIYLIEIYYSK
jgi:hypothetical protein